MWTCCSSGCLALRRLQGRSGGPTGEFVGALHRLYWSSLTFCRRLEREGAPEESSTSWICCSSGCLALRRLQGRSGGPTGEFVGALHRLYWSSLTFCRRLEREGAPEESSTSWICCSSGCLALRRSQGRSEAVHVKAVDVQSSWHWPRPLWGCGCYCRPAALAVAWPYEGCRAGAGGSTYCI
ncbi:hypothetical protein DIRU0_D24894 [Diutina rugosa]